MNNIWGVVVWNFEPNRISRVCPDTPLLYVRFTIEEQVQVVHRLHQLEHWTFGTSWRDRLRANANS